MIRLRQHIPGFVDGLTPQTADAPTQEALLATPWVARYAMDDVAVRSGRVTALVDGHETTIDVVYPLEIRKFHRWSMTRDSSPTLIVEQSEGRDWCVVGHIVEGAEALDLPDWVMHKDAQKRVDNWNAGKTSEPIPDGTPYICRAHRVPPDQCCFKGRTDPEMP